MTIKYHLFFVLSSFCVFMHYVFALAVGPFRGLRPGVRGHTEEAELVMPCRVEPLGVPLMALKMCSESDKVLLVPPYTAEIC